MEMPPVDLLGQVSCEMMNLGLKKVYCRFEEGERPGSVQSTNENTDERIRTVEGGFCVARESSERRPRLSEITPRERESTTPRLRGGLSLIERRDRKGKIIRSPGNVRGRRTRDEAGG